MKVSILLLSLFLVASSVSAADPLFVDAIIDSPMANVRAQFPTLKKEGCWQLPDGRFLMITSGREHPSRVVIAQTEPCKKPETGLDLDVQHRNGVRLGDGTPAVLERLGRPDAMADPEPKLQRLGDSEFFYICRDRNNCSRNTSIFMRGGVVTAIAEWYSE